MNPQGAADAPESVGSLLAWTVARTATRDEACRLASEIAWQRGDHLSAVELLKQAIALRPDCFEYHRGMAYLCRRLFLYDEAREHIAIAGSMAPDRSSVHFLSGLIHRDLLEINAAIAAQNKAIWLNNDLENLTGPYYQLSECHFLLGRFQHGWPALAQSMRLLGRNETILSSSRTLPLWTGSKSKHRIALICDRGLGDIIQFSRYIPLAAQRCAALILACPAELKSVLSRLEGVAEIAQAGSRLSLGAYCPLSSLPDMFDTDLSNIPARHSYLAATAGKTAQWRQRLERHSRPGHLKIGLVWAGSPVHGDDFKRSMTLAQFAVFEKLERVSLFSLQVGTETNPWPGWIVDFGNDIRHSLEDTMGLLANLDLVVTVDTAVAHLAGAMGVKTFVLLPFSPDGRWLLDRSDTPWYPALKLFRQPRWQDWAPVVQTVFDEISRMTSLPRATLGPV